MDWLLTRPWREWFTTGWRWVRVAIIAAFALLLIAYVVLGGNDLNIGNMAVKLGALFVGGELAMLFMRRFDRRTGMDFKAWVLPQLERGNLAVAVYRGCIAIAVAIVIAAALSGCAQAASLLPTKYDAQIKRAAERFMGPCQARWETWWAQIMTESGFSESAKSPVGAEGLAQFMPATAAEVFPLLGYGALDRRLAVPSIDAGAYLMGRLCGMWSSPRPQRDRHALGAASYNAGPGHILEAQRRCNGAVLYEAIMACLHLVTGRHAAETRAYWPRIERWARRKMGLLG